MSHFVFTIAFLLAIAALVIGGLALGGLLRPTEAVALGEARAIPPIPAPAEISPADAYLLEVQALLHTADSALPSMATPGGIIPRHLASTNRND